MTAYNRYFEANGEETQKWIFTVLERTGDTYAIYLYAGTKGQMQSKSLKVPYIFDLRSGAIGKRGTRQRTVNKGKGQQKNGRSEFPA